MIHVTRSGAHLRDRAIACVLALIFCGAPVAAQKNKKTVSNDPSAGIDNNATVPIPTTDNGAVDLAISSMLGAWQIGDADRMHQYYADDVLVVSGAYEPPIAGWPAYLRSYQALRARTQAAQLERINSIIKVSGNSAWSTYQWDFSGVVDGAKANFRGHTTLVFEKREGKWLIVLNHTSMGEPPPAPAKPQK
ncbi:MAG TPA: nuclear transport factor 2 family protein [Candidatus Acidoferrales bacterium]|jgi:ketosteroid isomerase-like protein|nr:nuclear transport factor 2 family protein [Candidatus Acidoferrales bacterium]